ncbi:MAG: glucosamine-6-phosphate deaminase [Gemmatimonadaceae bacterium]|nr:glucosamine-6-phosphate deaminase [Gemmatimonadaceae bacterium]
MASSKERVPIVIVEYDDISRTIAQRIAEIIKERRAAGGHAVLGLATGSTPIGIYRELIRMHLDEGLDFSDVVTFNLDEYYPMTSDSIHSYHRYMRENLFSHINVKPENIHVPRGDVPRADVDEYAEQYEAAIRDSGGIDLQILGIGKTGHIGFNEPGSGVESRTRRISLDTITRRDAAADFFGEDNVPTEAITMGVATIMEAREVALVATGEHKAAIVCRAVEGEPDPDIAATYLQQHENAVFYLDFAAAADLTRLRTPWVIGEVKWTREKETEAVIWLSETTGKSVLKLDAHDYREHHLSSLLARYGSAGPLNGAVFNALISKVRGRSKLPAGKRVVVFSPHPDDDVISMGGMLNKLHQNKNDIVVAYQTSGNIAVFDHEVRRYADFLRRYGSDFDITDSSYVSLIDDVESFLRKKKTGEIDAFPVQVMKRAIREAEAVSGIETFGMSKSQARFLNLPFYQTGKVRKDPIGPEDVRIVHDLLEEHKPELVFVAGDLSDPHGTHRMCLEAVVAALADYTGPAPEMWYYRGAWQEWTIAEADVLVPLSEEELRAKIQAIFKHQSQKDRAPFPGQDDREFWQRVEERNRSTAQRVDRLGLPEYFAMEAYVVRREGAPVDRETVPTSTLRVMVGPEEEPKVRGRRSVRAKRG